MPGYLAALLKPHHLIAAGVGATFFALFEAAAWWLAVWQDWDVKGALVVTALLWVAVAVLTVTAWMTHRDQDRVEPEPHPVLLERAMARHRREQMFTTTQDLSAWASPTRPWWLRWWPW